MELKIENVKNVYSEAFVREDVALRDSPYLLEARNLFRVTACLLVIMETQGFGSVFSLEKPKSFRARSHNIRVWILSALSWKLVQVCRFVAL